MSLRPMIFSNWWEGLDEPHHVPNEHFGIGVHPEHLIADIPAPWETLPYARTSRGLARGSHGLVLPHTPRNSHYYRPWWPELPEHHHRKLVSGGLSTVKPSKDAFQVVLDVKQFDPEEITVKVVDKHIIVEGHHDEKKDEHGWISRNFCRRYTIPEQCNIDNVESNLSSDGILTVSVPRKKIPSAEGERVISIQHTGKPAIIVKKPEQTSDEEKK